MKNSQDVENKKQAMLLIWDYGIKQDGVSCSAVGSYNA